MLYPIIDIGSNTVKLAVLDEEKYFSSAPVFFKAVPMCLRTRTVDGILPLEEIALLCDQVEEFVSISSRLTRIAPIAFATASLRGLKNQAEVLLAIRDRTGVNVEVLTGESEAYYAFLGALGNRSNLAGVTVDLGGGSTEILAFRKTEVLKSVSLPIGCLTLYERYFDHGKNDIVACREEIRSLLSGAPQLPGSSILLSGGSAKALLCYKNMLEHRSNVSLSRRQMEKVLWHFDHGTPADHAKVKGILQDRYRLVPPAAAVFTEILAYYGKEQTIVSRSGVREGRLKAYLTA